MQTVQKAEMPMKTATPAEDDDNYTRLQQMFAETCLL